MKAVVNKKKKKPSLPRRRNKRWLTKKDPVVNERLHEAFTHFLIHHPPKRFSINLRSMLLQFLGSGGAEAIFLEYLLIDLDGLFDLLTVAEEEWKCN